VALATRLLEADPLDEAALRALMGWLGKSGQSGQARQAYRDFTARLAADLGIAPGAELKAMNDSLAAPAPVASAVPADDGFIGRSTELRQLETLLAQPDCRLVCVIGPGGAGKTRLSARALATLALGYEDGGAFVPLEDARVAADIVAGLARELGIALASRRDPLRQVVDHLRTRQILVVFDNFEQLAAEAGVLDTLLRECPRVKVIVTSRVRLGLPGEQLLPLEGLTCPDAEDRDRIEAFDASRLFVKVARRVAPGFAPQAEAAAIVEICRRLDGMPLAIELAAAWARVMPCEAIAAQLREGVHLLHATDQGRPARHASMQVVFDETWRLLGAAERDALTRLTAFESGFTPEAAKSVARAPLPVLGALVDKSLLRKDGARLQMHTVLQRLAMARLGESDARETYGAHALHFLRLLVQQRRGLDDGERVALELVEAEFNNCRAAWRWAAAHPPREALAAAVLPLLGFCDHRFRLEEGLALMGEAIGLLAGAEPKLEALLLAAAAHLQYRLDRYAEGEATALRALAMEGAGSDAARLQCHKVLGGCYLRLGRYADAKTHFEAALRTRPPAIDPHNAAGMLDNLALVEKQLGRYDESLRLSRQSLVQHRLLGDPAGEALCLNNLGTLCVDMDERALAGNYLREALAICERHGIVGTRGLVLANLGELALKTGDLDAAEDYIDRSLDIAQTTGNRALAAWLRVHGARVALARNLLDRAREGLAASLELAVAIGQPSLQFAGISCFAELLRTQGEAACARSVLEFCATHPAISGRDRDRVKARLAALPAADDPPRWPGLSMEELVHRIVLERSVAHAPLVQLLRA
jgi:predicted ATPase/Tfp pilus assembly protein PilF